MSDRPGPAFGRPAWILFAVSTLSAVVSLGFSLAALPLLDPSEPTSPYVLYNLARAVAIVAALCVVGWISSTGALLVLGLLMAIGQALDGLVGVVIGDLVRTLGPLALAVVSVPAIVHHVRSPCDRVDD